MINFPEYAKKLSASDSPEEQKIILVGAGNYSPYALSSPKKSQDIPALVGVHECGDCVGIVGWDSRTQAAFICHMKEFDTRMMTYGFGKFILAILESSDTDITVMTEIKKSMLALSAKHSDYDEEVKNLLQCIKKLNLLNSTSFTLVSNEAKNVGPLSNFLSNDIGLESEQVTMDVPQNPAGSEHEEYVYAKVVLDRRNGEICKSFSYQKEQGLIYLLQKPADEYKAAQSSESTFFKQMRDLGGFALESVATSIHLITSVVAGTMSELKLRGYFPDRQNQESEKLTPSLGKPSEIQHIDEKIQNTQDNPLVGVATNSHEKANDNSKKSEQSFR